MKFFRNEGKNETQKQNHCRIYDGNSGSDAIVYRCIIRNQ